MSSLFFVFVCVLFILYFFPILSYYFFCLDLPPPGASLLINEFDLTVCLEFNLLCFLTRIFSEVASGTIRVALPPSLSHCHTLLELIKYGWKGDVCLVGEKSDKKLFVIVGARGDTSV